MGSLVKEITKSLVKRLSKDSAVVWHHCNETILPISIYWSSAKCVGSVGLFCFIGASVLAKDPLPVGTWPMFVAITCTSVDPERWIFPNFIMCLRYFARACVCVFCVYRSMHFSGCSYLYYMYVTVNSAHTCASFRGVPQKSNTINLYLTMEEYLFLFRTAKDLDI